MTFTVEQKSQLAKLMATENLSVQHQKIHTAKFDPTNRVLYLPIWQNMSGVLYDLLTGHEVGHALYTPAEGWHDAVADQSKGRYYKNFLNVVEDARIEKKVQRKYPGLRTSFAQAYAELTKRDFFGIKNRDLNEMSFIDRLNFFTKSQYTATWIQFNNQETGYIDRIKKLETWEDVVKLTDEIYGYCKEEQQEMEEQIFNDFDFSVGDSEEQFDYNDSESDDVEDSEEILSDADAQDSDETSEELEEGEDSGEVNRFKDSQPADEDFQPRCETDEVYRSKETLLLDEKSKEYVYIDIAKPILSKIVTPWKRVQEQMTTFYKEQCIEKPYIVTQELIRNWISEFKNKNERYIGLLAKEFEMRKAAKAFSKSKLSDTGDIDINKLASYKFDDNIFRKVMMTPKGKSHGLILLLDKSGSMHDNMAGSIEQILVLTMFCRKVNIPFIVYGFGDSVEGLREDFRIDNHEQLQDYNRTFEEYDMALALGSVRLREYLNSKMTNAEFSMAMRNMICLKKSFEENKYTRVTCGRPPSESLSNTPLTQAVIAVAPIINDFKRTNNLDMTSLVIVHDGDADFLNSYLEKTESGRFRGQYFHTFTTNVFLRDTKNKYQKQLKEKEDVINVVLDWFQKTTHSKIFGFFITPSAGVGMRNAIHNRYVFEDGKKFDEIYHNDYINYKDIMKSTMKKYKEEKFLSCKPEGYSQFFLVSGGSDLQTEEETIEIDGKVTASKLKNAFMKFNKKKAVNRVLVSKFIQGIAA